MGHSTLTLLFTIGASLSPTGDRQSALAARSRHSGHDNKADSRTSVCRLMTSRSSEILRSLRLRSKPQSAFNSAHVGVEGLPAAVLCDADVKSPLLERLSS